MKIYLDDLRTPPEGGWIHVRTYEEAIEALKTGKVEEISLDNDLGTKKEGYDVAKWIEQQVYVTNFRPPHIWIHSSNTVAGDRIRAAHAAIRRVSKGKGTFRGDFR